MYYLEDGFGSKIKSKITGRVLGIIFAVCAILASFGIGNMGQVNKITLNIQSAFLQILTHRR